MTTPAGMTTARISELNRLETTALTLAELLLGGPDDKAALAWTPRSLRTTPPGEVLVTLSCGIASMTESLPCSPSGPEERGPKVAEARQLGLRRELLVTLIRRLADAPRSTAKSGKAAAAPTAPAGVDGKVVGDAVKKALRVAKTPIAIGEMSKRTGYPVDRIETVLPGMRKRGVIEPKGKQRSSSGHQENLWVITAKGLES